MTLRPCRTHTATGRHQAPCHSWPARIVQPHRGQKGVEGSRVVAEAELSHHKQSLEEVKALPPITTPAPGALGCCRHCTPASRCVSSSVERNLVPARWGRPGFTCLFPLKVTEPVNGEEVSRTKGISATLPGRGPSCHPHSKVGRGGDPVES